MTITRDDLLKFCNDKQAVNINAYFDHNQVGSDAAKALGKNPTSITNTVNRAVKRMEESKKKARENEPKINGDIVGIIGDTHLPYELDGYLEWCMYIFKREGVTKVIHIGDLFDNHALSFHDSEPSLKGAYGEYIDALERLKPWKDAFPQVTHINGNHDAIPARQLTKMGLDPKIYLRPVSEVYEFPEGWETCDEIIVDGVLYHHGHTACGANGFRNDAKDRMQNTVSGHAHGNCGVSWTACHHRAVWGMAVGCGIDNAKMAFAYGKHFKSKPIVACGVVSYGKEPRNYVMDLGES